MSENTITDTIAPMRLRAEPPRVTRLSRKMLAGVGAVALLGIGGALIPDIVEACSTMDSNVPRPTSKRRIDGAGRAFGDLDLDAVDLTPAVAHSTKRCPASVNRAPADRRRISHVLSSLAASGCGCSSMASLD